MKMMLPRFRLGGRCNVCGFPGLFRIRFDARDNLRETLNCVRCGSISRDRFLTAVLAACLGQPSVLAQWPVNEAVVIREPSAYRGRARKLAAKVDYRPFRFPAENLEALGDADASIDHLITSDVFEHVRLDQQAFREVYRVLKPGGFFLLQVPYVHTELTRVLVRPEADRDVFLAPPQYHDEHTLVYRIYGHDLLPWLEGIGFAVAYVRAEIEQFGVSLQDMIVCRKGAEFPQDVHRLIEFDRRWRQVSS
jgi:SAM-dependent methyltransferase